MAPEDEDDGVAVCEWCLGEGCQSCGGTGGYHDPETCPECREAGQ